MKASKLSSEQGTERPKETMSEADSPFSTNKIFCHVRVQTQTRGRQLLQQSCKSLATWNKPQGCAHVITGGFKDIFKEDLPFDRGTLEMTAVE